MPDTCVKSLQLLPGWSDLYNFLLVPQTLPMCTTRGLAFYLSKESHASTQHPVLCTLLFFVEQLACFPRKFFNVVNC